MNCTYRSIFNEKTGTFVAASENASSAGKKTSSCTRAATAGARFTLQTLAVSVMLSFGGAAFAGPTGGVVTAGSANITSGASNTTITQSTQNAAINWLSFNIGTGEAVRFVQPNSSSVTLNRVLGSDPSSILGTLSANGKVFLVNPNGVLFGQGASVNVGGLVASTLNVTDNDFMAGSYKFAGAGNGAVVNQGSINADGGYVALLGANVANNGVITAKLGSVALAAGNAMTLDVAGDGLLNVTVNQGVVNALVQNGGLIQADGGQVLLSAQAAGNLLSSAVNNTGVIQAQTLQNHKGVIKLMGGMQNGSVNVGGTLDASAPNGGDGGFIETSAAHVKVADNVNITTHSAQGKTGNWLIDPVDFIVGTDIAGATLSALLVTNSVNIDTVAGPITPLPGSTPPLSSFGSGSAGTGAGDITVSEAITWTATPSPTTLTLNAAHDVNINAAISATTGSLVFKAVNDINMNAAITTITGDIHSTAGRDLNVNAAVTQTTGDFIACCGRAININAAMTMTTGNILLRAPTVTFADGILYTVTVAAPHTIQIQYSPTSYDAPVATTYYSDHFTGTGKSLVQQQMLVALQVAPKTYDGTTTANLSLAGTPGAGVTLGVGTAVFDSKNAGSNVGITYTGYTLGGTNAALYALADSCFAPGSGTMSATIAQAAPLVISAVTDNRVYNSTTSSSPTVTVAGLQTGDTLSGPLTQAYGSKNVMGTMGSTLIPTGGNTVNDGNSGNNYSSITYVNTPGTITQMGITGAITAANKVYDGNNTATITSRNLTGVIGGDTVSYTGGTATFNDKNVADGKAVTGTGLALAGTDAGNYSVNTTAATTANVTPLAITGAITAADKVYDSTTAATITSRTLGGTVAGDTVSYTGGTATFDTADIGTGKPVTGTGLALAGTDAGNYTVNSTAATTATIIAPFAAPPVTTTAVPPGMTPVVWVPTITPGRTPPQLMTFVPPVAPVVTPPVAQYVAPVEQPVVAQEQLPIVAAVQTPPEVYVAPHRVRKQDRN
jgi:filamentous hemagglutinin family protein